jgi:radical SAM enzyme (TIGR01210 family)
VIGIWYDEKGGKVTIVLKSFKCSWNRCVFCCFSDEAAETYHDLMETDLRILKEVKKRLESGKIRELTIFNGGSFFELPYELILKISELTPGKIVNIETRPEFVNEKSLTETLRLLGPKGLVVRIGFESSFEEVRRRLNKGIPNVEVQRIIRLRKTLAKKFRGRIEFVAYVLFGLEGLSEESVKESVEFFSKNLDGVIAIKYRKYKQHMPNEIAYSEGLINFLKVKCREVDLAEGELWEIGGK